MYVTIPIIKERKIDKNTNKVDVIKDEIKVRVDTSFLAHLKWEQEFQEIMKCDLNEYTQRIASIQNDKELVKTNMLGVLKLLYCYIHSDDIPSFKNFLQLLDYEVAEDILNILSDVLNNISKSSVSEKK